MRQRIWDGIPETEDQIKRRVWLAAKVCMSLWLHSQGLDSIPHGLAGITRLAYRPGWLVVMEYTPGESDQRYAKPLYVIETDGIYLASVLRDEHGQID